MGLSLAFQEAENEVHISASTIKGEDNREKQEEILQQFLQKTEQTANAPQTLVPKRRQLKSLIPDFSWREAFVPGKVLLFTPLIFWLNVLLFIAITIAGADILHPDSDILVQWGANYTPATMGGEPWRLLTSVFLHIGIEHLLANMIAFVFIGIVLEPVLGKGKFLFSYLVTGIMGSIFSVWWHPITLSAGASGAIFGMYGVYLALLTTNLVDVKRRKSSLMLFGLFIVYSLAGGLKEHIDNAAHIGGLVSGIVLGYFFYPALQSAKNKRLEQEETE